MKERPIIFNGEEVRAVLRGRKTKLRRVRKYTFLEIGLKDGHGLDLQLEYGQPGDRLWVKETWHPRGEYRATPWKGATGKARWCPPSKMPRWASRITLEVTGVMVERLQEISQEDAIMEGFPVDDDILPESPRKSFASAWNSLNAKRGLGWDKNPWVWVISFRRVGP